MNIGIFSGSFNPIHVGHLILANYIVEFTEIDEVWFLVSPHNPLKSQDGMLDESVRLGMAKLALEKYPKLKVSDFEFSLSKPSYTINTLENLEQTYPEHKFTLIIGADNWNIFHNWKDYGKILNNYSLKVYPRLGYDVTIPYEARDTVKYLNSPIIEISSTFIRKSIAEGKDVRAFLPDEVYAYIMKRELYK